MYEFHIPPIPSIKTPEPLFTATEPVYLDYEDTMFSKMADDIKSSYENQLNEISATLDEQLAIAKAETATAKKEAKISLIFAIVSILITIFTTLFPIFL